MSYVLTYPNIKHIALPSNGPQLSLLDTAEVSVSSPPTALPFTTIGQLTNSQLAPATQVTGPLANDDQENQLSAPQQRTRLVEGPIVRCLSARSFPVSQLRLAINNQPVELARLLENSTLSFSDGTESNVVVFRLKLADFARSSSLEKAASAKKEPQKASNSTATSTNKPAWNQTTKQQPYANALVQFNDKNVGMKLEDFKLGNNRKQQQPTNQFDKPNIIQSKPGKDKQTTNRKSKPTRMNQLNDDNESGQVKHTAHLEAEEQRVSPDLTDGSMAANANSQLYSNYIRIKCTSLVGQVGYEMSSELNVPIAFLSSQSNLGSNDGRIEGISTEAERIDSSSNPSSRLGVGSGGLQSPQSVSADRLAQASSPNENGFGLGLANTKHQAPQQTVKTNPQGRNLNSSSAAAATLLSNHNTISANNNNNNSGNLNQGSPRSRGFKLATGSMSQLSPSSRLTSNVADVRRHKTGKLILSH